MGIILLALILGMAQAQHQQIQTISETSLQWLNKTTMKVVWPDEKEDIIFLTVSQNFPELKEACIFEGSPGSMTSNSFSAAVVGCMDSEETIVNLGLKDKVLELSLLKNGTSIQDVWIESPYDKNLPPSRTKREAWELTTETGGYLESSQPSADRTGSTEEDLKIPKAITFPLDLGYDEKLYQHLGSHSAIKTFIAGIVNQAGPFFKPPFSSNAGLPTISWATDLDHIKPYFDVTLNADKLCDKQTEGNKKRFRKDSTPLMLFTEDLHPRNSGTQTTGCAFMTTACGNTKGEALGIVDKTWDWYSETQHKKQMANTMAHEFGHMLGMHHDFDNAKSSGCDGTGIMSYGKRPDAWSTCSVSDFQRWWRIKGFACKEVTKDYDSTTTAPDPCSQSPCGTNAECENNGGKAVCRCPKGLVGDPNVNCGDSFSEKGSRGKRCNKNNGKCSCSPGYQGVSCKECEPGYYKSGSECKKCHCDINGGDSGECDDSGQCYCNEGFKGRYCNSCKDGYYGAYCSPCNCHEIGSKGYSCDGAGVCDCRSEYYTGNKCQNCLLERLGDGTCSNCNAVCTGIVNVLNLGIVCNLCVLSQYKS